MSNPTSKRMHAHARSRVRRASKHADRQQSHRALLATMDEDDEIRRDVFKDKHGHTEEEMIDLMMADLCFNATADDPEPFGFSNSAEDYEHENNAMAFYFEQSGYGDPGWEGSAWD